MLAKQIAGKVLSDHNTEMRSAYLFFINTIVSIQPYILDLVYGMCECA